MSIPVVIPWLPVDGNEEAIAFVQNTTVANEGLILNSTVPVLPQGPYVYDRVIRSIILTRDNHVGASTAKITGIGCSITDVNNPNPTQALSLITENLDTVNNGIAESVNIYSQILSITLNNAVTGISVGFGTKGITDYVFLDYNRKIFQTNVQLQFVVIGDAEVTVYQSLSKPQIILPDGNLSNFQPIPAFEVSDNLTGAATNQIGTLLSPVAMTWATIKGTTDDLIYFTVLQQGIT